MNFKSYARSSRHSSRRRGHSLRPQERGGGASTAGLDSDPKPTAITESISDPECGVERQKAELAAFEEGLSSAIDFLYGEELDSKDFDKYADYVIRLADMLKVDTSRFEARRSTVPKKREERRPEDKVMLT